MTQPEAKKRRQLWIGIVVSAIGLASIFYFVKPSQIIDALKSARYGYVGLSIIGIVIFMLLRALRWRFMLNNDVPYWELFHIQSIGAMLTNTLPFRIGDIARAVMIGSVPPVTIARGVSTMVVERILDMMFIVTLLPFTLAEVVRLPDWMRSGARASGILAIGATAIVILAANNRKLAGRIATWTLDRIRFLDTDTWVSRVDELLAGLSSLTHLKDGLILLVYSVVIWIPIIAAYYAVLLAVNIQPTWPMAGFVVCAAALSIAAPSSPGQIGVFHAGVLAALAVMGQPEAESASFAFLYHALNVLMMVILGSIGFIRTGATFGQVVASAQKFMKRSDSTP